MLGMKYQYPHLRHIFIFEIGNPNNIHKQCIYCNVNYEIYINDYINYKCLSDEEKNIKNIIE